MDHFAQAHLSELLSTARQGPPRTAADADEWKRHTLMCFNAAWAALQGVGAVSAEERTKWSNRMLVALGERPLEPPPSVPGVARITAFSFGRKPPRRPPDLEGLPDDDGKILRDELIHRLQMLRKFLALGDDVGTAYLSMGDGSGGGGNERPGHTDFRPAVPADARRLAVRWDDMEFDLELPPDRRAGR